MRFDTGCSCCRDDFYDYEEWLMQRVSVITHPLAQHALTRMRDTSRSAADFRAGLTAAGAMIAYDISREAPMTAVAAVNSNFLSPTLAGPAPVFIPLGDGGMVFAAGMSLVAPHAVVGAVGVRAGVNSDGAVEGFFEAPVDVKGRAAIVAEPFFATGDNAIAAVKLLKDSGADDIRFVCALAAPEGIEKLRCAHPAVDIWVIGIDSHLDERGNIIPGAGDIAARLSGAA